MTARRAFVVVVLLYLALDFTHPSIPGAVSFDADACTEAVRAARARVAPAVAPAPAILPETGVTATLVPDARPIRREPTAPPPPPRHRSDKRLVSLDGSAPTNDH